MAFALQLYSRPKVMRLCLDALNEFFEGRINKEELERRARELEDKQLKLFQISKEGRNVR